MSSKGTMPSPSYERSALATSRWVAEVALDEPDPIRRSNPRRDIDPATEVVDGLGLCVVPIDGMVEWLDWRSVGGWRLVEKSAADEHASVPSRAFQFQQWTDGRFFAAVWADEILRLRLFAVERRILKLGFPSGLETTGEIGRYPIKREGHRLSVEGLAILVSQVWPLRRRMRQLLRLREQPGADRWRGLVAGPPFRD
jgi:hypothetical protein